MYAGAAHADASEYRPCIHLWNYALGHSYFHNDCNHDQHCNNDHKIDEKYRFEN